MGGAKKVVINGYDLAHELLVKRANVTSNRVMSVFPEDVEVLFSGKNKEFGGKIIVTYNLQENCVLSTCHSSAFGSSLMDNVHVYRLFLFHTMYLPL